MPQNKYVKESGSKTGWKVKKNELLNVENKK